MKLVLNEIEEKPVETFTDAATLAAIIMLVNLPNGIQRMNPEMPGMVQKAITIPDCILP